MLVVATFLDKSISHGIGIYADELIKKGELIWQYNPLVDVTYNLEQWNSLKENISENSFKYISRYAYKENNHYILCTDNAQFMNHDHMNFNVENSSDLQQMYASREIQKGEELLCNYFEYSDEDDGHVLFLKSLES